MNYGNRHAFILASGGYDSTCLLAYFHLRGYILHPVKIKYDSRQIIPEVNALSQIIGCFPDALNPYVIDLSSLVNPSSLSKKRSPDEVETGEYKDFTSVGTVVPGRNLVFLAHLANLAEAHKIKYPDDEVVISAGVHSSDWEMYPDCRPEFIAAASQAIKAGSDGKVLTNFPFIGITKDHIVDVVTDDGELTLKQNVLQAIAYSYSCYRGDLIHCGTCPTCIERHNAFMATFGEDPTHYKNGSGITGKVFGFLAK